MLLNLFCHFLAIIEVYLIVRMLGAPATLLGALILESLTKLINVAGSVNPGNVGTYEGGNMVIGRLVRTDRNPGSSTGALSPAPGGSSGRSLAEFACSGFRRSRNLPVHQTKSKIDVQQDDRAERTFASVAHAVQSRIYPRP